MCESLWLFKTLDRNNNDPDGSHLTLNLTAARLIIDLLLFVSPVNIGCSSWQQFIISLLKFSLKTVYNEALNLGTRKPSKSWGRLKWLSEHIDRLAWTTALLHTMTHPDRINLNINLDINCSSLFMKFHMRRDYISGLVNLRQGKPYVVWETRGARWSIFDAFILAQWG